MALPKLEIAHFQKMRMADPLPKGHFHVMNEPLSILFKLIYPM